MKELNSLTYVEQAEKVVSQLDKDDKDVIRVSTNQIRSMLTLTNELYERARNIQGDKLDAALLSHIQYVRMHLVYQAGRDKDVKELLKKSELIDYLKSVGNSKSKLLMVCHYMESLVAYHRYYTKE